MKTQAHIELENYWRVLKEHQAKPLPSGDSSEDRGARIVHQLEENGFSRRLRDRSYNAACAIDEARHLFAHYAFNDAFAHYEHLIHEIGMRSASRWLEQVQDEAAEKMSYHLLVAIELSRQPPAKG